MENIIITSEEAEEARKKAEELRKARAKACLLIKDAQNRYIKEKTKAKSKKAAEEKDAILKSPRFKCLELYDRFEEIQEAYGWDIITESERDKLEELWEEREKIKEKTVDGIYTDEVTEALRETWEHAAQLWEDEINNADILCREYEHQRIKAEMEAKEWLDKQNAAYERLTNGRSA